MGRKALAAISLALALMLTANGAGESIPGAIGVSTGSGQVSEVAGELAADEAVPAATKECSAGIPEGLPWATVFDVVPGAVKDPATAYTGQTATPKQQGTLIFADPSICSPVGILPKETLGAPTTLPIIATSPDNGWHQILIPSRRALPSAGNPANVNHASVWLPAASVTTNVAPLEITVDLTAKTVKLFDAGREIYSASVEVDGGLDTVRGRSFVVGVYSTPASALCSSEPAVVLAHASTSQDDYEGSGTALNGIHGFSPACRLTLLGGGTPGCVVISDSAVAELLRLGLKPGTPVTVR